jgi:HEAT repeat protein
MRNRSKFNFFLMLSLLTLLGGLNCAEGSHESKVNYQNPSINDSEILIRQMISGTSMEEQSKAANSIRIILGLDGGLESIVNLLDDDDAETRADTATYIGSAIRVGEIDYNEPLLIDPLMKALDDGDSEVRWMACSTVSDIILVGLSYGNSQPLGDNTSDLVQAIILQLKDDEQDVIVIACNTLAFLGVQASESTDILISLLADQDFIVRLAASTALAKIDPGVNEGIGVLIEGVLYDNINNSFRIRPNIDGEYPSDIHRASAQALGLIGPTAIDAIPALTELFDDPKTQVQEIAAQSIADIAPSDEGVIELLNDLLSNDNPNIRRNAALTLGLMGYPPIEVL